MHTENEFSRKRWGWGIAAAIALIYLVALPTAVMHGLVTCGGDGGSPYAAPASPRGKLCESGIVVPWLLVVAPGTVLGFGLIGINLKNARMVGAAIGAGLLALLAGIFIPSALSKECSGRPESMTAEEFYRYQQTDCGHY